MPFGRHGARGGFTFDGRGYIHAVCAIARRSVQSHSEVEGTNGPDITRCLSIDPQLLDRAARYLGYAHTQIHL
jgi:hypothetical protein